MTNESIQTFSGGWQFSSKSSPDTQKNSYLDERSFGKSTRTHVKEFGALFGLISMAVFGWALHKNVGTTWLAVSGVSAIFFLTSGYFIPSVLHPIWKAWMSLAHGMGLVMTFLILSICWTIVLFPMAAILRIIGKSVMDTTYDPSLESYWVSRSPKKHDFSLLENQY